jgi:hypothetical protein
VSFEDLENTVVDVVGSFLLRRNGTWFLRRLGSLLRNLLLLLLVLLQDVLAVLGDAGGVASVLLRLAADVLGQRPPLFLLADGAVFAVVPGARSAAASTLLRRSVRAQPLVCEQTRLLLIIVV